MLNITKKAYGDATMKPTLTAELISIVKGAPRLYFAPLIGAIKEVRSELRKPFTVASKIETDFESPKSGH